MFAAWSVICIVALSTVNAQFKTEVMESGVKPVSGGECPESCSTGMDIALKFISGAFATFDVLKEYTFSSGFCKVVVHDLGNFQHTYKCMSNEAGDIHDHEIDVTFGNTTAILDCSFSNSPAAAAKKINEAPKPKIECGTDKVTNTVEEKPMQCDGDADDKKESPTKISANLSGMGLHLVIRADSRTAEHIFPLRYDFTLATKNPATLKESQGFEDAFKCVANEDNMPILLSKVFIHALKPIFSCLDKKEEHDDSFIEKLLFTAGSCGVRPRKD